METNVIYTDVNYGRRGYLNLKDNLVIFDTSDEEYGLVEISLDLLEQKIKEHKEKLGIIDNYNYIDSFFDQFEEELDVDKWNAIDLLKWLKLNKFKIIK